jgi:hypothetical protein
MPKAYPDPFPEPAREMNPRPSRTAPDPLAPAPNSPAGLGASRLPAVAAAVVALIIVGGLIILGVILFSNPPAAATLRDIFIVFLGIQSILIGLLLIVLLVAVVYVALKLYDLAQFVQNELRPILHRADDTMRTVNSRTVFISDAAVKPIIEIMACASAIKSILRSFTRSSN